MERAVGFGCRDQVRRELGWDFGVHLSATRIEKLVTARVGPIEERRIVGEYHDAVLFQGNPLAVGLDDSAFFEDLRLDMQIRASQLRERQFLNGVPLHRSEYGFFGHLLILPRVATVGWPVRAEAIPLGVSGLKMRNVSRELCGCR